MTADEMAPARCHSCDDGGHLTSEHCWWNGQECTCGTESLWGAGRPSPCPLST